MLTLFLLSAFFIAKSQQTIEDPNAETRTLSGSFHAISVGRSIELILVASSDEKVVVTANKIKIRDRIKTDVVNGELKIRYDADWGVRVNRSQKDYMRVYVSYKLLDAVKASGASRVQFEKPWETSSGVIRLSGASSLQGAIQCQQLEVELSGASGMRVSGKATRLNMELSGASHCKGYDLEVQYSTIESNGASSVQLSCDKEMSVKASGASSVYYKGNAVVRDMNVSGASTVKKS